MGQFDKKIATLNYCYAEHWKVCYQCERTLVGGCDSGWSTVRELGGLTKEREQILKLSNRDYIGYVSDETAGYLTRTGCYTIDRFDSFREGYVLKRVERTPVPVNNTIELDEPVDEA